MVEKKGARQGLPPKVMQKRWQKARFTGSRNRYCSEKLEFPGVLADFSHYIIFERCSIERRSMTDPNLSLLEQSLHLSLCSVFSNQFKLRCEIHLRPGWCISTNTESLEL